jgi:hypothetical protein
MPPYRTIPSNEEPELTSSTLPNQKGKPTARPTLRWIFQ